MRDRRRPGDVDRLTVNDVRHDRRRRRHDADVIEAEKVQVADDAALSGAEGERVTDDDPQNADERDHDEALHDRAQRVLGAGKAGVEETEAGRHEHDEGGGGGDPARIAGVYLWWHDCYIT